MWLDFGPPSVLNCCTSCRYPRPALTTSNQRRGVVLHGTVGFTQVRNQNLIVPTLPNVASCVSFFSPLAHLSCNRLFILDRLQNCFACVVLSKRHNTIGATDFTVPSITHHNIMKS